MQGADVPAPPARRRRCVQTNQRICLPPTFAACQYVRTAGERLGQLQAAGA